MTDVSSVSGANSSAAAATAATAADVGKEFNSFIKLLTAQVQNQDPLAPLDSTQFVEQLATFSSLEQQVHSNDTLEKIATLIGDLHTIASAGYLGSTVSVETTWAPFNNAAVEYAVEIPASVERADLIVRNAQGELVYSGPINPADESYAWTGETDAGDAAPAGLYQFGIDLYQSGQYIGTVAPRMIDPGTAGS
ncbi:MAG: flagellar biosynthesis protein FlgD [Hyphomonas sp.]|nr:flagellar biosynthesis protein FlgD [Hyphomonas sp.]